MSNKTATTMDGREVTIGDTVQFKCDTEQCGVITSIDTTWPFGSGKVTTLTLAAFGYFSGDYIGGDVMTDVDADECW